MRCPAWSDGHHSSSPFAECGLAAAPRLDGPLGRFSRCLRARWLSLVAARSSLRPHPPWACGLGGTSMFGRPDARTRAGQCRRCLRERSSSRDLAVLPMRHCDPLTPSFPRSISLRRSVSYIDPAGMRTIFYLTSLALLGLGALALVPGLVVLLYSHVAPMQPPPALDEGAGLGRIVGWFLVAGGALSVIVGTAPMSALRATRPPHETAAWAHQHKRLW
jgi:hypothetical protein